MSRERERFCTNHSRYHTFQAGGGEGRERERGRKGGRERGTQHYLKAFGALCIGSVMAFK
jgi:hypothetical protein